MDSVQPEDGWNAEVGVNCWSIGPPDKPLPTTKDGWRHQFGDCMALLRVIERFAQGELESLSPHHIKALFYNSGRCQRLLERTEIKDTLHRLHDISEIIEVGESTWPSWHEALGGIARGISRHLYNFHGPWKAYDGLDRSSDEFQDQLVSTILNAVSITDPTWPFPPIDCDKLWSMVELECSRLHAPLATRKKHAREIHEEWERLHKAGMSHQQIGDKFHVSKSAVSSALRRLKESRVH